MKEDFEMKKRVKQLGVLVIAIMMFVCGCGGGTSDSKKTSSGKTEVVLWHTWGTKNAAHVQTMADEFNASQDDYEVTLVNQASAGMIRQKLAALTPEEYPAIFCGTPTATCYYDSVSYVKPLQEFLDADEDNWEEKIYSSIKTAYSNLNGELVGSPFGVSSAGYFVNLDMLKKAGYTLEDVTSFEKMVKIAIDVYKKGIAKYGISYSTTGVELINTMTLQGIDVVDNGNGYDGEVTASLIMEGKTYEAVKEHMSLVASSYEAGAAMAYGSDSATQSFYNGSVAFYGATNSWTHYIVDNGATFEWAFVPDHGLNDNAKYKDYALTEGTGFYITNSGNEKSMQGAYEFIKFVAQPEKQAMWCSELGYLPYTEEASTQQVYVDWVNENCPSLLTLSEKIKNAPAELRGPYTRVPDDLLNLGSFLYNYISTDPTGEMKDYFEEATLTLDEAIEIQAMRNK